MNLGCGRRIRSIGVAMAVGAAMLTLAPSAVDPAAAGPAPPTPTLERVGPPGSIASIGDSISTATGTGNLGAETPSNAWVTGTNGSVNSMRNRLGIPSSSAYMLASNGRRMQDFDNQANAMPASNEYAVLELGGNDLCRDSVSAMTSSASYRAQFRAGLAALRAKNPETLLFVASVPDIYNLWYIRGAPSSVNPYVADQTGQAGQARLYWDFPLIDIIPCQSLLDNPESTSAGDEARRQAVRQRNKEYNQILEEECSLDLRCRFDDHAAFNTTSNRVNPPDGALLPRAQWGFEDIDISHDDGFWDFLCPAPGVLSGGTICGDHFHPSLSGQAKLAAGGHAASFDFTDVTAPLAGLSANRPPDGSGVYASAVGVTFTGSDNAGLRGQEVRVHHPNGAVDDWFAYPDIAPPMSVSEVGTSYVEVRSVDINGNHSASEILDITIDPTQFGRVTGVVHGPLGPLAGIQVGMHLPGSEGAVATTATGADGSYTFDAVALGDYKIGFSDPTSVHLAEWHSDKATHAEADVVTVPSGIANVDALLALDPGPVVLPGSISGVVTSATGPPAGVTVRAVTEDGTEQGTDATGADGLYEITGLAPDDYDIEFVETACWAGEWFDDQADQASADAVAVPADATVTADAELTAAAPGPHGLSDVPAWLDTAVRWLVNDCNDPPYMSGYPDGTFRDGVELTRAQAVRTLYRVAGSPDASTLIPHGLSDVPAWVEDPVTWARAFNYMTGYPDGTFGPGLTITRAQLVRLLYRLEGSPDASSHPPHGLSDVPAWVESAVRWAKARGVINGFPDGTFGPDLPINRGQFANSVYNQNV